jgi:dTDP-4-dehydrorhamnose reductase
MGKMKIFVLGAKGQLGSDWEEFLEASPNDDIEASYYDLPELDISDKESVERVLKKEKPHVVINCAAYTKVDQAETEKELARRINAESVEDLAILCESQGILLVHYSTDYIFAGRPEDEKRFPDGYPEEHKAEPINWYGQTKWEAEEAIRKAGDNHLIIRVAWLCGQYGGNFIKTMLRLGKERDELKVVNDQTGSPTFTENAVKNTMALIKSDQRGTFHLTSKGKVTWFDLAQEIFRIANLQVVVAPVTSEEFKTEAKRPHYSKMDTTKIAKVEGVEIEDWKVGLQRLISKLR